MRVAIVSTWDADCGIATYTRALRDGLAGHGVDCDVVPIERSEVKYAARSELKPYYRALADRLDGYDVVHVQHEHGFFAGAHALPVGVGVTRDFLARLARGGRAVHVTFHTEPLDLFGPPTSPYALAMGAVQRAHWRAAIALLFRRHPNLRAIVHTRGTRRTFVDSGVPAGAIDVVPHGIHPPRHIPEADRRAARERLGFPPGAVVLAQFGFLAAYKGIPTAVRAVRRLPERFHLAVLGDVHPHGGDETLERVLAAAAERDEEEAAPLGGRLRLEGWVPRERLDDWRAAASIAVAPYHAVPGFSFSGALTWGITAGVPIVAGRIPAFIEAQEAAGCLVLIAPDSPRELAHRVLELEADPEGRDRLAAAARTYAERTSWERVAERHAELYARRSADQAAASRTSSTRSWRSARSASTTSGSASSQDGASRSRPASSSRD